MRGRNDPKGMNKKKRNTTRYSAKSDMWARRNQQFIKDLRNWPDINQGNNITPIHNVINTYYQVSDPVVEQAVDLFQQLTVFLELSDISTRAFQQNSSITDDALIHKFFNPMGQALDNTYQLLADFKQQKSGSQTITSAINLTVKYIDSRLLALQKTDDRLFHVYDAHNNDLKNFLESLKNDNLIKPGVQNNR